MSSFVELRSNGLAPKDPRAHCDACGCVGTVSRAIRHCDGVEQQHWRFCAACWVEESARLRARWDDEDAKVQDAAFRTGDQQQRPNMGSTFESATWHGARAFLSEHILPQLHSAEPLSAEYLRSVADRYRAAAPDMVGEMPLVIERFIAEYGSRSSSIVEHDALARSSVFRSSMHCRLIL